MEYQLKRQIFFSMTALVLAGVIIFVGYKSFKTTPTCSDGVLNQNEEKIDCGGLCQACKVTRLEDIKVLSSNSFLLSDGSYDAFAEIKNPNLIHGVESLSYTFSFYNADNKLIEERAGKSYISANQTRYIIESNIRLPELAASTIFSINHDIAWQKQDKSGMSLPVFSQKYEPLAEGDGSGFAKVSGIVDNKTGYDLKEVEIGVVLVDQNNKIFAVGKTQINNLRFGENRLFAVFFPEAIPSPYNIYVSANTNVFDAANAY